MKTQLALLRAVNLPRYKQVNMAALRDLLTELGFKNVRSLLQSGNLVFESEGPTGTALEHFLEEETKRHLSLETEYFVRSTKEWQAIIARNPFGEVARRDPGHLVILLLKKAAEPASVEALQASIVGPELVQGAGREVYVVYPEGIGRSRLTTALVEKKLQTRVTGRNWNTVCKLAAVAKASG